jgi:hypothetical protein
MKLFLATIGTLNLQAGRTDTSTDVWMGEDEDEIREQIEEDLKNDNRNSTGDLYCGLLKIEEIVTVMTIVDGATEGVPFTSVPKK